MQNLTKNEDSPQLSINPKKIAIFHTGALGDLLVSSATIYESMRLFPNSEFTIIGSKLWKDILIPKIWPQIKYFVEIKNKKFCLLKLWAANSENNKWQEIPFDYDNFVVFLKQFDMTIDFRTESLRFAIKAFLARIPVRVGSNKSIWAKAFFTHFTKHNDKVTNIHERNRYLNILSSLYKENIDIKMKYWEENGLPFLKVPQQTNGEKKLILINPTASIREKAWPSEKFRQLAMKLKDMGHEVAIIGAPRETDWLKEVASEDFRIIQPRNIAQLVEHVEQAKLLVTNTSAMQFIAASTKTKTLTLMGSARPEKWGPLGEWSSVVKGKEVELNTNILNPRSKTSKISEVLSYNSISVNDVLHAIGSFHC